MMKAHLILAFPLLLTSAGAVLAQTPDGQTPAEETVCDNESGAAFGLCNAYCEAMDCNSANPQASATACSKVKSKYTNITGRNSLPCEAPPCPCNVPGTLFGDAVAGNITITACHQGSPGVSSTEGISISDGTVPIAQAAINRETGAWFCTPPFTPGLSPEVGMACAQLLEQAANAQGVICQ